MNRVRADRAKSTSSVAADEMSDKAPLLVLQDWLETYLNFEHTPRKNVFWLDTMEFLCHRFKNPQTAYKTVHIAGSKGKGSVSAMIASILEEAGFKTGLYTSPHILNFAERIGTATTPFSDEVYESAVRQLTNSVDSIIPEQLPGNRPITWFELVTTFAFLCFKQAGCEWGVFETGLGGRLDATNVLHPALSVVTPIELEHTEFLGDTIEKIATEKAGIIKQSTPVCVATQSNSVTNVFKMKAAECNSRIVLAQDALTNCSSSFHNGKMDIELDSPLFSRTIKTTLSLLGKFQAENAGLASIAVKTIYPNMDESTIEKGLAKATLPGRFEISGNREFPVILDGAHTVKSISFTLDTFQHFTSSFIVKPHLLFACAADKDVEAIAPLFKEFDMITLTRPGNQKESNPERLQDAFASARLSFTYQKDYSKAISNAIKKAAQSGAPLLITGSFYLVAEAKRIMAQ